MGIFLPQATIEPKPSDTSDIKSNELVVANQLSKTLLDTNHETGKRKLQQRSDPLTKLQTLFYRLDNILHVCFADYKVDLLQHVGQLLFEFRD